MASSDFVARIEDLNLGLAQIGQQIVGDGDAKPRRPNLWKMGRTIQMMSDRLERLETIANYAIGKESSTKTRSESTELRDSVETFVTNILHWRLDQMAPLYKSDALITVANQTSSPRATTFSGNLELLKLRPEARLLSMTIDEDGETVTLRFRARKRIIQTRTQRWTRSQDDEPMRICFETVDECKQEREDGVTVKQ